MAIRIAYDVSPQALGPAAVESGLARGRARRIERLEDYAFRQQSQERDISARMRMQSRGLTAQRQERAAERAYRQQTRAFELQERRRLQELGITSRKEAARLAHERTLERMQEQAELQEGLIEERSTAQEQQLRARLKAQMEYDTKRLTAQESRAVEKLNKFREAIDDPSNRLSKGMRLRAYKEFREKNLDVAMLPESIRLWSELYGDVRDEAGLSPEEEASVKSTGGFLRGGQWYEAQPDGGFKRDPHYHTTISREKIKAAELKVKAINDERERYYEERRRVEDLRERYVDNMRQSSDPLMFDPRQAFAEAQEVYPYPPAPQDTEGTAPQAVQQQIIPPQMTGTSAEGMYPIVQQAAAASEVAELAAQAHSSDQATRNTARYELLRRANEGDPTALEAARRLLGSRRK